MRGENGEESLMVCLAKLNIYKSKSKKVKMNYS